MPTPTLQDSSRRRRNSKDQAAVPAFEGKLPPQALDMERAVIGAMMIERDAYDKVCEILNPNSFYDAKLGKIYQAIVDLSVKEEPVDLMTVSEQLKKNGTYEEVGGDMALMSLTENVGSAAHIEYHARIVADKNLARELIRLSSDVLSSAYNPETDIDELMNSAEGRLFEVSQKNVKRTSSRSARSLPRHDRESTRRHSRRKVSADWLRDSPNWTR